MSIGISVVEVKGGGCCLCCAQFQLPLPKIDQSFSILWVSVSSTVFQLSCAVRRARWSVYSKSLNVVEGKLLVQILKRVGASVDP